MTDRLTLLSKIYVPRSLGANDLLEHLDHNWDKLDHDDIVGVRYLGGRVDAGQYFPILAEETVTNLMPVSAEIMRKVVADKLWCPWRLERDGWIIHRGVRLGEPPYRRVGAWIDVHSDGSVFNGIITCKGIHTYSDLITLVRLVEG